MRNIKIKKAMDEILNKEQIGSLVKSFNEAKIKTALQLRYDIQNKKIFWEDFSKSISVNDIIEFDDKGNINKAVVTGKGKTGVTARDAKQNLIKIKYNDILNYKKRDR